MHRPCGWVTMRIIKRGELLYHAVGANLFVNAGLPALAALLGGDTTGEMCSVIGFGSGSNAPTVNDLGLTAPSYYKAIDSHSENGSGSVTFNWSLTTSDSGAQNLTIQEIGLFANQSGVGVPGGNAPTPMLARKTLSPIVFSAGMSISGTWTLTF